MATRYLFNTSGQYVAFADGENVFAPDSTWFGVIRNGNELFGTDGEFLGYILNDDRVAKDPRDRRPRLFPKPRRPLRPLKPLRPLRRLRMARLPKPYVDVFEHGDPGTTFRIGAAAPSLEELEGSDLVGGDEQFLGRVTRNAFDPDSILNEFRHGSPYGAKSIFNSFSPYRNPFSSLSPYNQFTRTPPRFVKDGAVIAYLTTNDFVAPKVHPDVFFAWLGRS